MQSAKSRVEAEFDTSLREHIKYKVSPLYRAALSMSASDKERQQALSWLWELWATGRDVAALDVYLNAVMGAPSDQADM